MRLRTKTVSDDIIREIMTVINKIYANRIFCCCCKQTLLHNDSNLFIQQIRENQVNSYAPFSCLSLRSALHLEPYFSSINNKGVVKSKNTENAVKNQPTPIYFMPGWTISMQPAPNRHLYLRFVVFF